jgi:hypothetical protein
MPRRILRLRPSDRRWRLALSRRPDLQWGDVMLRDAMLGPALVIGLMASIAGAQESAPLSAAARPTGRVYKIAVWYDDHHPTSIQHQTYDLAKGEYDAVAVARWVERIRTDHSGHGAYVRDLQTYGLPGATEKERLANAIEQEKVRWAAVQRRTWTPLPADVRVLRWAGARGGDRSPSIIDRTRSPSSSGLLNRPTSPFPYPYRSRLP